jgi:hypothetical protein
LVTARQQLRKEALLGNGWPQQYQGRVFYGVGSQAINTRERSSSRDISLLRTEIEIENTEIMEIGIIENADLESSFVRSFVGV